MDMLSLVEAARKTGLTTLAKAVRSGRFSVSREDDGSHANDPAELGSVYSFPAPSAAGAAPGETVKVTVPAVRRAIPDVADAELRYRISRAEESLIELKSALEEMRSQRDAWQAMAQAKLLPANRATLSWWRGRRSAG
jgi:hypothetical protein